MIGMLGQKGGEARGRRVKARLELEQLEGRALLTAAAFTLADTLYAKDNIVLEEIYVKQTIEENRINNLSALSTTISDGQNQTQAIASDYASWVSQEAADRAANDSSAVAYDIAQQKADLATGQKVRSLMRLSVSSSNTTQRQLLKDEGTTTQVANVYINQLAHLGNPTTVQTHAITAIDNVGTMSQKHYTSGLGSLDALDTLINSAFTPPADALG